MSRDLVTLGRVANILQTLIAKIPEQFVRGRAAERASMRCANFTSVKKTPQQHVTPLPVWHTGAPHCLSILWALWFYGSAVNADAPGGCARVLQHPALVALGEYSFAVYLFQLPLIDFAILVFGDTSWSNPVTQGWVLFVVFWLAAAYSRLVDVPFSRLLRGATAGWEHRGEAKLQESKV